MLPALLFTLPPRPSARVVLANGFFAARSLSLSRRSRRSRPSRFPDTDLSQLSNYVALSKVAAEREALNCLYIHPIAPPDSSLAYTHARARADSRSLRERAWVARTLVGRGVYGVSRARRRVISSMDPLGDSESIFLINPPRERRGETRVSGQSGIRRKRRPNDARRISPTRDSAVDEEREENVESEVTVGLARARCWPRGFFRKSTATQIGVKRT